ncbi:MAG: acyl-CoA dehydrogenase family protein, partial [Gemmatimonadaceae bacterium]
AAKFCLTRAAAHAATRVQFGQPIGQFELLQQKLAFMAAGAYAMEAMTYQTAALIDAGAADYMLETALLKVFATETLWRIVNDTIQVFGGRAYFTDEPYERLLRDARINTIGEGANDVLRAFAALVGLRDVGLDLQGVLAAARQPLRNLGRLGQFAGRKLESWFSSPHVEVSRAPLEPAADELGRLAGEFGGHVERLLRTHREAIVDRQHCLGRVADAAAELYASACVLRRLDCQWTSGSEDAATRQRDRAAGLYYLATAARRIRRNLDELWSNDDDQTNRLAALVLARAER